MSADPFIWIDLETTGLDPDEEEILEVGIMVTNADLVVLDAYTRVVKPLRHDRASVGEFVNAMHDKSGLWDAIVEAGLEGRLEDALYVEQEAIRFLLEMEHRFGFETGKQPMCGSSVSFDRGFLRNHMPNLEAMFHYRNIDVSTMKELLRRRRPDVLASAPTPAAEHRSLPDLHDTIAEANHYFTAIGI